MKKELFIVFLVLTLLSTSCDSVPWDILGKDKTVENKEETIDRFLIEEDGKFGYINHLGEVVITPQFEKASTSFSEGLANVKVGGRWGFINEEGKFVINPQFEHKYRGSDHAYNFSDGMAQVEYDGKWGYIDKEGILVVSPQFDFTEDYTEGLAVVLKDFLNDKWGYIDKEGNYAINPQFDLAAAFSEGLAEVLIGDKCGFIDKDGKYVINPQFDFVGSFMEDLAWVSIGDKFGFINKEGKYVVTPQFDNVSDCYEDLIAVEIGDKWGFINREGKWVINPQFDEVSAFSEGLATVDVGGKYGYIDKEGKYVINPQFDNAVAFHESLAIVKIGGKWGCVDKQGKYVINPQFDSISRFSGGLARVENDSKWGYIDKEGNWIWQSQSQDNIGKLYRDSKKRGYNASEEEFRNLINSSAENRENLYKELKTLGMKFDEATFMEYIGYPLASQNKDKSISDFTSRTQTSTVSDSQSTIAQGSQWPTYSIPNVCSIMVPPTMELRDDNSNSGKLFSAINPVLYKMMCNNCDVFSDQSRIIFQPEGMNSDNPKDIDRATATYARIIIEFGYNHDVSQEDVRTMTTADLAEYDEIIQKQYKSEFEYAQQKLGKTGTLVWHPIKRERIGGKYCIVLDYDRPGLQGMVKVKKYAFYYDGKEADITCSYRISEKQKYEKDFEKVIRSIKFD